MGVRQQDGALGQHLQQEVLHAPRRYPSSRRRVHLQHLAVPVADGTGRQGVRRRTLLQRHDVAVLAAAVGRAGGGCRPRRRRRQYPSSSTPASGTGERGPGGCLPALARASTPPVAAAAVAAAALVAFHPWRLLMGLGWHGKGMESRWLYACPFFFLKSAEQILVWSCRQPR